MSPYPTIVPYLSVSDATAAIDFYKRAFGAELKLAVPGPNRPVMHAEILINGGLVMLTDSSPENDFAAPSEGDRVPAAIMVGWPAPADVDALFARAVEAGATAEVAPKDEPWGARFAGVTTPSASAGGCTRRWRKPSPMPEEGSASIRPCRSSPPAPPRPSRSRDTCPRS